MIRLVETDLKPACSPLNMQTEHSLTDLADYYVIRRFTDGWFLGEIGTQETIFVTNLQLVQMGYLSSAEETVSDLSPAIVIPVASREGRADLDTNWRKKL